MTPTERIEAVSAIITKKTGYHRDWANDLAKAVVTAAEQEILTDIRDLLREILKEVTHRNAT